MSAPIRAVERAVDVLMCFTNKTPSLTMTQIAEMVGMNKSTVHRLLATLEGKRFVERDPVTAIYKPGMRLLQLAFLSEENNDLRSLAAPFLQDLSRRFQENVNLAVLDGADVMYLAVIESRQRVKLAAASGQRLPAFCTASGKALLAYLPEAEIGRILDLGMPGYTPSTITSPEAFLADSSLVRERGFAISEEEFEAGINAISTTICNPPLASVSIAGPAFRLTRERMLELAPELLAAAKSIATEVDRTRNPGLPLRVSY